MRMISSSVFVDVLAHREAPRRDADALARIGLANPSDLATARAASYLPD
jgi:hypothetical protein